MRSNFKKKDFFINLLMLFIVLTIIFTLFDLYTPIESVIKGKDISIDQLLSSIKIYKNLPSIIGGSVAIALVQTRKQHKQRTL